MRKGREKRCGQRWGERGKGTFPGKLWNNSREQEGTGERVRNKQWEGRGEKGGTTQRDL